MPALRHFCTCKGAHPCSSTSRHQAKIFWYKGKRKNYKKPCPGDPFDTFVANSTMMWEEKPLLTTARWWKWTQDSVLCVRSGERRILTNASWGKWSIARRRDAWITSTPSVMPWWDGPYGMARTITFLWSLFSGFRNNTGVATTNGEREWGWSSLGTEFE